MEELAFLAIQSEVTLNFTISGVERAQASADVHQNSFAVLGDEAQLYRLFSNVIVNAIQATPAQGKVTVRLSQDEEQVKVQVVDTGMGIALENQPYIFDRFYRINSDRSRHTGGSGLGLAIVKAIILAHRGKIQVHSNPGKGSRFVIYLPRN